MKYKIVRAATSLPGSVDLSPEEYEALKRAKKGLVRIVEIEEKFDLLLENYAEYERSLLELTLHYVLYRDLDWTSFRVDIRRRPARAKQRPREEFCGVSWIEPPKQG